MEKHDNDDKIASHDWRLQAVSTLAKDWTNPFTKVTHKAGCPVIAQIITKLGNNKLIFALPSMTALFLDLSNNLWLKSQLGLSHFKFPENAHKIENVAFSVKNHSLLFDLIEMRMGASVFGYCAIESYANDIIPGEYTFRQRRHNNKCIEEYDKGQIEKSINLDIKLDLILPDILKIKSPKGTKIWQRYNSLKQLRNRIMHIKSIDKSSDPSKKTIWNDLLDIKHPNSAREAYQIIGYFITKSNNIPRWYKMSQI